MSRPVRSKLQKLPQTRARFVAAAVIGCYATVPAWAQKTVTAADLQTTKIGNFTAVDVANGVEVQNLANRTMATAGSFHVLAGQTFNIKQGVNDAFMVKVTGIDRDGAKILQQSVIEGNITSPGQFWLQNAAGTIIKPGAVIDVARFVATLGVTDANFLSGRLTFENPADGGKIVNQGTIKTPSGGSVYLVGTEVSNEGVIRTPQGETILAAGEKVEIVDTGTPGVTVQITGKAGNVTNLGHILADAGRIGMVGAVVRNSGTLNASSGIDTLNVVAEGGRVFLKASQDAYVDGKGRIVSTGTKGGTAEVLGNRVAVTDEAEIDVSGTNGGGTILVGGDYKGKNPDVQNAAVTYFGPNAKLKADALYNGDGGKVIVWADDTTRAYGSISARGGAYSGNGGFVETSGYRYLDVNGIKGVDTRAPFGRTGTWLLDPSDMTIVSSGLSNLLGGGSDPYIFSPNTDGIPSQVDWGNIESFIGGTDIAVTTNGNIFVNASPTGSNLSIQRNYVDSDGIARSFASTTNSPTYSSSHKLSLLAQGSIHVNSPFGNSGSGAIVLVAGWDAASETAPESTYATGKDINLNAMIATNGALTLKAHTVNVNAGTGIDMTTGTLTVIANRLLMQGGASQMARIASAGNQRFTLGELKLTGSSSGYGGSAVIEHFDTNTAGDGGTQEFEISGGTNKVILEGGSGTGVIPAGQWGGDCSYGGCSGNSARIENRSSGAQSFHFASGGTMALYGGTAGTDNSANIESRGAQTISGGAPVNILISGGQGGGATTYGGITYFHGNDAGIDSKTSQTINAAGGTLLMYGNGNASSYGGAYLGGSSQNLSFGNVFLLGGNSSVKDNDGFGSPVAIGEKNTASITLSASSLTIAGGAGTSSPVGIGSLNGTATVTMNVSGPVNIYSGAGGVGIGSIGRVAAANAAGGVYIANGTTINGSAINVAAFNDVQVYGGLVASGALNLVAGGGTIIAYTAGAMSFSTGAIGSTATPGNVYLGSQSKVTGNPTNFVAYNGSVIDDRTSSAVSSATTTIVNTILNSTTTTTAPEPTTTVIAAIPSTTGGISGVTTTLGTGTVGGGSGQFGDTSSSTGSTATTTSTSGTSTSTAGGATSGDSGSSSTTSSTTTSGESGSQTSSTSDEQSNGSKDSKDDKKDDKSKKADSGEKKDDKSKSKPVGKCSA